MLLCIMLLHCVHRGLGQSMTPTTRSCSKWGWGRCPRSLNQLVRSCSTLLAGVWSMTRTRGPRRWSCFLTRFWRWVTICSITITNSFTLQIRWKLELLSQLKWIKHFCFSLCKWTVSKQVEGDDECISCTMPSILEDYLKLGIKR